MLLPNNVSPSWNEFLTEEVIEMLNKIEDDIGADYTPQKDKIMRFLTVDLDNMKVCLVGQDVYYQPGIATGRSFEVNGLTSWHTPFPQTSLRNILRLIYKSYNGIENYDEIKKFKEILLEIENKEFLILSPNELFDSLEKQGVLFLNTYLTCKIGNAKSHRHIWEAFSVKLFEYISIRKPEMYWFLWGTEAQLQKQHISNGVIYECRHPMMCSKKYSDDFLKSECIKDTMHLINWMG